MEIKENEYIRTYDGVIAKCEEVWIDQVSRGETTFYDFDKIIYYDYGDDISFLTSNNLEKRVKKHSMNILDLIEVGDVVKIINEIDYFIGKINEISEECFEINYITYPKEWLIDGKLISIETHEKYEEESYNLRKEKEDE